MTCGSATADQGVENHDETVCESTGPGIPVAEDVRGRGDGVVASG